jgi:hypothetical protein
VGRRPAVRELAIGDGAGADVVGSGFVVVVISWLPRIPCDG